MHGTYIETAVAPQAPRPPGVDSVRAAMASNGDGLRPRSDGLRASSRIVEGKYFDWCIRLDYGAEGKLRLVYELAKPNEEPH